MRCPQAVGACFDDGAQGLEHHAHKVPALASFYGQQGMGGRNKGLRLVGSIRGLKAGPDCPSSVAGHVQPTMTTLLSLYIC